MKTAWFVILFGTAAGIASVAACGSNDGNAPDAALADSRVIDASTRFANEGDMLGWLRQEEKLAHDVYVALIDKAPPFTNISASEQTHTDAVKALLVQYGLPDPAANLAAGVFSIADLQTLHDALVAKGSRSVLEAIAVGLEIEELDIADIREMRDIATHADVLTTLDNLERGSRNHLRAFWKQLQQNGGTYVPTHLSQTEFLAIATSPQEMGGGAR